LACAASLLLVLASPGIGSALGDAPAQVQYGLSVPDSGGYGDSAGSPDPDVGGDKRPAVALLGSVENKEVILLLLVILTLTALAAFLAFRAGRLGRSRRTVMLAVAGLAATALLIAVLPAGGASKRGAPRVPGLFYGMSGQTLMPQSEHNRMKQNGVDSVRLGLSWNVIEPSPGVYSFTSTDPYVERAARARLDIFPFLGATPTFYGVNCDASNCFRNLPAQNSQQLNAWKNVVRAIWGRYGPRGSFWAQNPGVPKRPFRSLQPWNESNFKFFTEQRSPQLYGKLVKATDQALRGVDRGAKVILAGLFAHPKRPQGPQATTFLNGLYRVPGIKNAFEGVSLHPYAKDASDLRPDINAIRRVMKRHGDARTGLYLTEFGWGSGTDTAFEKGIRGQVRELAQAYTILRQMQRSARIQRTYWFAWNDLSGNCNFCDSAGLVREDFSAKPALGRFRSIAKGH
jgi:hypothetical protein